MSSKMAEGPHPHSREGDADTTHSLLQGALRRSLLVATLLAAAVPASAHTPTHTFGPSPTATPTGTPPPPRAVISVSPNPARAGQQVLLDGTASGYGLYEWSQVSGEVGIDIAGADRRSASFVVPPLAGPSSVGVQLLINGGFPAQQTIDLLPARTVRLEIDSASGAPGTSVDLDIALRPVGLAVTALRTEITFDPFAAIAVRNGRPGCRPGAGLAGSFTLAPDGCTPQVDCDRVRAVVASDTPIPDRTVLFTCTVDLDGTTPAPSCEHQLTCPGGEADTLEGAALDVDCRAGTVRADYAAAPLAFEFRAEPERPMVGDPVSLAFVTTGDGGLPSYTLLGAAPFLTVTAAPMPGGGPLGTAVFEAAADCPGVAQLRLAVYHETTAGCPGNMYFYFRSVTSPPFPLTIEAPGGFVVAGRVAEFPDGCQGAMRGVTVRLDPLGWTAQTDLTAGTFSFGDVPPGEYTLSVVSSCNPFGCWAAVPVSVQNGDVALTLCPQRIGFGGCAGDCDDDGRVTMAELIAGVGIALAVDDVSVCAAMDADGDGAVTIAELTSGLLHALNGCPGA